MNKERWNSIISQFEQSTILQTWEWGLIKSQYGWKSDYFVKEDAFGKPQSAGMILSRAQHLSKFGPAIKIFYIPHGPLIDWNKPDIVEETFDYLKIMLLKKRLFILKLTCKLLFHTELMITLQIKREMF